VTLASLPPCPESKPKHNCVGTEDYSNGNKYVGEFRSGKPDGYGTYTYPNGDKYIGEVYQGLKYGPGTATYADGRIEQGVWKEGKFQYARRLVSPIIAGNSPNATPLNNAASGKSAVVGRPEVKMQGVPGYFRVTGVASDDSLNVRSSPSAASEKLGEFAFDADIIEVVRTDKSGRWGYVRTPGSDGMGWTSMRYLQPTMVMTFTGTLLPVGLSCGGTEPHWNFVLTRNSVRYYYFGKLEDIMLLNRITRANANSIDAYTIYFDHENGTDSFSVRRDGLGQGGMADLEFLWSVNYGGGRMDQPISSEWCHSMLLYNPETVAPDIR
jgi:hypothetical protein